MPHCPQHTSFQSFFPLGREEWNEMKVLLMGCGAHQFSSSINQKVQLFSLFQKIIDSNYCYNTFYFVLFLSITNERKKTQQKDNLFVFLAELIDEWSDWRAAPFIKINFINFILRDEMLCVFLSQLAHHSSNQLHFLLFFSKTIKGEWKREIVWVCWGRKHITHNPVIKEISFLYEGGNKLFNNLSFHSTKSKVLLLIWFHSMKEVELNGVKLYYNSKLII